MKVKFYLLPILLFLFNFSQGQDCSSLSMSSTVQESRCVATGSISITASGGSGNYNYQAIGPVTTPVTSSNVITGLPGGSYTIRVMDITSSCTKEFTGIIVPGNYSDPRFQLNKTDGTCAGNDGTITAVSVQYGRSPFTYTIIAPSPSSVGSSNNTGHFTGLAPGEYFVQLRDSCGGIQVRAVTIEEYNWWINGVAVTRVGCDSADVLVTLTDNNGNTTSVVDFSGFTYGVVRAAGDTLWFNDNSFRLYIGNRRFFTIVVKDGCGNMESYNWSLAANLRPSLGSVSLSNLVCASFTASVTGQNLTSPEYCLFNSEDVQIACNATGTFNNLPYGSYCIKVSDDCYDTLITRCFTSAGAIPSVGGSVTVSGQNCSTFTATVTNKLNLTNAEFCLFTNADVQVACNATGVFTNVPYGSYCIRITDGCVDTTITRCFTASRPVATLNNYSITGSSCTTFNVSATGSNLNNPVYCLFDNLGNVITCNSTGVFTGVPHGNYCIRAISCGDTTNSVCFGTSRPVPSVAANVQITNRQCSTFTATITGQTNLTSPEYCIYNANDSLLSCNATGVFTGLAYGSYCIKLTNTCYDTVITRCFTTTRSVPSINSTIQLLSSDCSTVSFKATGSNLISPSYNLYDDADNLLATNTTGTFNNYPYGSYCIIIDDGCVDTLMKACRTFTPVRGISLSTSKSCTIGYAYVDVQFANANSPYEIEVFHPDGSLEYNTVTSSNPARIQLAGLPSGTKYTIIGIDDCGNRDTALITPDANMVTKSLSVRTKCPSSTWLNGAGDLLATCSSNYHSVTPKIIKKNGNSFVSNYSSVTSGIYTFADLEPATYIMEYTQSNCNGKMYDTVTVAPYAYPSQGQSAIYQCDNNSFSLGADVQGGVSPYSFQIIGSMPTTPDITTSPQPGAVFTINTGTTYSLVRLRTLDACGNATLSDVSVLPLQNISVAATDSCFFRNITLSVDTIPNAVYLWYRKTSPTDSVLIDSSISYNLPFFVPEQVGEYICKVIVNDGCITRLSSFNLNGICNMELLPVNFRLQGKRNGTSNQLSWTNQNEEGVLSYIIERKRMQDRNFITIATVHSGNSLSYIFNDNSPGSGRNEYRVRVVYNSKAEYTNIVSLQNSNTSFNVYPNPVQNTLQLSITGDKQTDYKIELMNNSGQLVFTTRLKNVQSTVFTYNRDQKVLPGMYLLKITDLHTNEMDIRKFIFE